MLTFKQFRQSVLESALLSESNIQSNDINTIVDFIKANCKQFIQESKLYGKQLPLYRGIKKNEERTFILPGHTPSRGTTGLDQHQHDKLNALFKDKFKIPFLDGTFCSGGKTQAEEYGYVYGVFPIGHYEFTYNPAIHDMFYGLQYGKNTPESIIDGYTDKNLANGIDKKKELIMYCDKILYVPEDLLDDVYEQL
jgi:hypothetical protein